MRIVIAGGLAAMALVAAACSGTGDGADPTASDPETTMPAMMPGMMGDVSATPARDVEGATLEIGSFGGVADGDAGGISGDAVLARHAGGTTLTVSLEQLPAASDFTGHLHSGACADGGGPHYRHDPDGSELPPNEIHIAFSTDDAGAGFMTVENPTPVSHQAASVVIHAVGGAKLVCADLVPLDS